MRFFMVIVSIWCLLSVSVPGGEPIKLKILYAGNPGSDRTTQFESFLKEQFSEVAVTDTSKFIESEVDNFDVVIFDWTRTFDETGRMRSELRIQNPPRLSEKFSRPAVLIGETGGRVTSELKLKLDWLCLCLFDSAHQLKLNHEVFHHPLEVAPELAEVPTPEDFPYHSIDDWGPTMKIWKTQTVNYPHADVGMCHTLYGFEDSPDAEMFARGIGMKGPDCVALSRQANYFHWGFSVPPSQMTESARRLFVNAICYVRKFDGARPLIRQVSMPREWALKNAQLPGLLSDKYREITARHFRLEIVTSPGLLPERYEGDIDRFIQDQLKWVEPEMKRVLPSELRDQFGNDVSKWRAYYQDNLEYLRPGEDPSVFVVDVDAASLRISNRDVRILDHCIGLLERRQDEQLAHRLLDRYTEKTFDTPAEWRAWFVQHKNRLFFCDSAGYRFRVRTD
jgi:hypothetical protein